MKLIRILTSLAGAGLALGLTLALALPAQEPPSEPPTPAKAPAKAPDVPAPGEAVAKSDEPAEADDMRELGAAADGGQISTDISDGIAELINEVVADSVESANGDEEYDAGGSSHHREAKELVQFGADVLLPVGKTAREVVAILANAVIDGEAEREVVAIMGDVTINGSVGREAVAVLGDVTINGTVDREVVAVLGRVQLGPEAVVKGNITSVGGTVDRAPGSRVDGQINQVAFMGHGDVSFEWLKSWIQKCLMLGRPLAFGEHLGWAWMLAGCFLGFYFLLALIMPSLVTQCAETMEKKPGMSVLSAILTMLITPIAMIVLSVTVVGPPIIGLMLFFVGIFGKVVFLGWLGRRITEPAGWKVPALAVLIGGVITTGIYLIPFVGFAFMKLSGFLGTGIVVYTIILAMQSNQSATPAPASPPPAPDSAGPTGGSVDDGAEPIAGNVATGPAMAAGPEESAMPPPAPAVPAQLSTLPRVGFWGRFAATLIDIIVVAIVVNMLGVEEFFAIWATVYFIVFWSLRGTTLGGVVLGIKVVRLDDRKVDWSVALVRGLGSFLSLFLLGLGFLWVSWDPNRQSWHDKIAGTTVVKMPRGVSLI